MMCCSPVTSEKVHAQKKYAYFSCQNDTSSNSSIHIPRLIICIMDTLVHIILELLQSHWMYLIYFHLTPDGWVTLCLICSNDPQTCCRRNFVKCL